MNATSVTFGSTVLFRNSAVAIDSGLSFIAMPASDGQNIANLVGADVVSSIDGDGVGIWIQQNLLPPFNVYRLKSCDYNTIKNLPVISFLIGGTNFTLTGNFFKPVNLIFKTNILVGLDYVIVTPGPKCTLVFLPSDVNYILF